MRDTDPVPGTPPADDPLVQLFAPLRTPEDPTDARVRTVRANAERRGPISRRSRAAAAVTTGPGSARRAALAGAGGLVVVVAAVGVAAVVDRSRPGTFVGEASAGQLLRAAAGATRDDPAPDGWRWTTTTRVDRMALEGRRCRTCAVERALLETRSTEQLWSGPRGETYSSNSSEPARALEGEALLRHAGALDPPGRFPAAGSHRGPAAPGTEDSPAELRMFGAFRGGLPDPTSVPDEAADLVDWVTKRQAASWKAQEADAARRGGGIGSSISNGTRVSYTLIDFATSPQLSGRQQAAAFEALATRPRVTAVPPPALFASDDRVAVRIAAEPGDGYDRGALEAPDRVIVFDRATHRVVAEEAQPLTREPKARMQFGSTGTGPALQMRAGGGGETRYGAPVDVTGPGLDGDGRRLLDLSNLYETGRDGIGREPGPGR